MAESIVSDQTTVTPEQIQKMQAHFAEEGAREGLGTPRQQFGEVVDNPIQLDRSEAEKLINGLNADLGSLFVLFHQYQKHHWVVEGPQFRELHLLLEEFYNETRENGDEIAERITALGGVPVSGPRKQAEFAYVEHEPEGIWPLRNMLERDLAINCKIIQTLRGRIQEANQSGDYGTENLLKAILLEQEDQAHELQHMLEDETLTRQLH
ncbi:MAG: DNA starvation/stationary phase protection protein [Chloroflexota bacterium]|nr:DNA starvation/stationary phase protection protein [Chloroflexota bacterium]